VQPEAYFLPKRTNPPRDGVPSQGEHELPSVSVGQRTVIVVEDEWLVRAEIVDALHAAGWAVVEATSGEEAIEIFAGPTDITLLVTDIRLLGPVDGWDVAEAFRAAKPDGLVLYASANSTVSERQVPGSVFVGKPSRMGAQAVRHRDVRSLNCFAFSHGFGRKRPQSRSPECLESGAKPRSGIGA
jgi:CheY-like chemotaxis protein